VVFPCPFACFPTSGLPRDCVLNSLCLSCRVPRQATVTREENGGACVLLLLVPVHKNTRLCELGSNANLSIPARSLTSQAVI
jgi:hypothetical protein